ncbi:MAG: S41 family peptidase [Gemmatimonadetes bacterium]|nr:S41 family peptidase [Gemmatimonadota bacterium]
MGTRVGNGLLMALLLWLTAARATPDPDPYTGVNESWDRFGSVYGRIVDNYYASIDQKEIMQAAIEGMLDRLDTYSQFYDEEGLRQLRQDTTGKFAGLGITVAIKDHYPVVISPIEGTPADRAGLLPGDLIVAIEGRDTRDLPLDEIVDILRGEPGTQVRIEVAGSVRRMEGREVTITREVIKIKSVPLVEELDSGIGYISMRQTRFSEDTGEEVERALEELKAKGVKGVVLDLRGNPGGLLSQATQVADLFLPKGAPIVAVKEREGRRQEVKKSQRQPAAGDLPLVVLIDGGSASASEIVAGAIQDNDRGIILGTTSFGKGSVQTIFDLQETEDAALKLTTALYYTPSGRSIHRDSFSGLGELSFQLSMGERRLPAGPTLDIILRAENLQQAGAALRARFDLEGEAIDQILSTPLGSLAGFPDIEVTPDSSTSRGNGETYFTRKGRKVYGGGGITPDLSVEGDLPPDYVLELERRRLFFDFIVDFVAADSSSFHQVDVRPEKEEELVVAFREFLRLKDAVASYEKTVHRELDQLRTLAEEMGWSQEVLASINRVSESIDEELSHGFTRKLEPYIREGLRRELGLRLKGRKEQLRIGLERDAQLEKAIEVLLDGQSYRRVLDGGTS